MKQPKSEQLPPEPIVLSVGMIADAKFYAAGSETPFSSATLPEHLREYIATGDEDFFDHNERNIYYGSPARRGRAKRILGNVLWQAGSEDVALEEQKLPEGTEAALRDAAERHSALGKAQLQSSQDAIDRLHESLAEAREPLQRYVRRGSVYVRIEKAKLAAGEPVFVKHPGGNHEIIGTTDVEGQPPEPPISL